MACVPTEMALSEPPNIQSKISEGNERSLRGGRFGHGRCEKKMMSTSLTAL